MENINDLVKYDVTEAALESYRVEFLPLTISGVDDREGYEKVREARLFIKGERVNVEKTRVRLKAESLEYGRMVDAEAKRITAAILEVEGHLEAEQKKVDDEIARRKFEKEQREKLPERMAKLLMIPAIMPEDELLKLDDMAFADLLNRLTAAKLEEQRLVQEETDRKQKEAQAKLDAEKKQIEDKRIADEREAKHKAELEQARKDAAEKARLEAELEAKRKEDARIEAEKQAKLDAERLEAERPDKDKLKSFAIFFETGIPFPEVSSKKAVAKLAKVRKHLEEIVSELRAE